MKNIEKTLSDIGFAKRYILLCNKFSDFNNGKNFTKKDIIGIFNKDAFNMEFNSKESLFFKNYVVANLMIRFLFGYKYGFIDCRYWILEYNETLLNGSFREIALMEDKEFNEKVAYRFPIATSLSDLKDILDSIFNLNDDFISKIFDDK